MTKKLPRITGAYAAEAPSIIEVKFNGGPSRRIDLAGWIAAGGELLAPLRDWDVFQTVRPANYGAALEWRDVPDAAIDAVHLLKIADEQQPFGAKEPPNGRRS